MEIVVNGERRTVEKGTTVGALLRSLSLSPARVAVERNRRIVHKAEYEATVLAEQDRLEIVTFVGGG